MKNSENQRLNEYINNIQKSGNIHNDNSKDNYYIENNNNKNIQTDKRGSKFEKQSNIKLFYKNKKSD